MLGKINFKLNEKLSEGKTFEIKIDTESIGKISKNNPNLVYNAQSFKKYSIVINGGDIEKNITINLNSDKPEETVEIITKAENNKFYLYLTFVTLYILVIVACYFILEVDIYYILILMVLALPLIISKLVNNTNDKGFKIKTY